MKKKITMLCILLALFFSITTVNAKSSIKDLFQYDEKIEIKNEIDGTAFLAGDKVIVEKKIKGIGFIAANTLTLNDNQEYIFAISSKNNMEAKIKNDIFLLAEEINFNGEVCRDAYIYSTNSKLNGEFNRNVYIAGEVVELNGTFKGNINVYATEIKIGDKAKIEGTLKYNKNAIINGLNDEVETKTYINEPYKVSFVEYLQSFIMSYVNLVLLALLLVFMCEKVFIKSLKQTKNNKISSLCIKGFILLIGIPIIVIMTVISGWFNSIGVITGIIYGILIYVSSIFTGYYLATELDKHYLKKNMNSYMLVIFGVLLIKVLSAIPIIGGVISMFSLLLGLGITGNMIIDAKK